MKYIGFYSGGLGSYLASKRLVARHGTADLRLLFTDTLIEDEDLYRFLIEGAADVFGLLTPDMRKLAAKAALIPKVEDEKPVERLAALVALRNETTTILPSLAWVAEGRTPWEVFRDVRFLGNSQKDPCSKVLKRQFAARWLKENCDPAQTTLFVGIDWTERKRFDPIEDQWERKGWRCIAPLCEPPYLTKASGEDVLEQAGIRRPALYDLGFKHNNCGGMCCKAGHSHHKRAWELTPRRFWHNAREEQGVREHLGQDVAMMKDRRGGASVPLPMAEFGKRMEAGESCDQFDWGGCGCFASMDGDEE